MEMDKISCKIMEWLIKLKINLVKVYQKGDLKNKIFKARWFIINSFQNSYNHKFQVTIWYL
jgi:hypothetical protein